MEILQKELEIRLNFEYRDKWRFIAKEWSGKVSE